MTEHTSRPVEIEYNGEKAVGKHIIEGSKYRYQKVTYKGRTKSDSFCYEQNQTEYMNGIAQQLLREIMREIENGL